MKIFILISLILVSAFAQASEKILTFRSEQAMNQFVADNADQVVTVLPELLRVVVRESQNQMFTQNFDILSADEPVTIKIDPIHPAEDLGKLWGLKAIEIEKAWKFSVGANVIVAVSDTGIWTGHSDLKANFWQNPGETGRDGRGRDKASNGIDDDKNGYVDDIRGWNFVDNNSNTDDSHYHGTHVAGTIAAASNGFGVIGVAPQAKLMAVKFIGKDGSGTDYQAAQSIIYAAKNGAKIINCSWGGSTDTKTLSEAIRFAQSKGALVVAAAGNDNRDTDRKPHLPSTLPFENILSVGAISDAKGTRSSFSNWGKKTVDIAAPGEAIYSTVKPSGNPIDKSEYARLSGTSMAAPHVSGLAALIWAQRPAFTWVDVKATILNTGKNSSYWKSKSVTGKVINARAAVESVY